MDTTTATGSGRKAGPREWIGLAVLALPTLALATDMSALFLAGPSLGADLHPSSTELLWIMDIYGFMIAGFLTTMGTLGDRIGRRRLLMAGGAAFGVGSIVAANSVNAEMLISVRALLGIAGATLMPSTLALISNMFQDPKQRGLAIAAWMSCFMGGTAIGPVIGGILLESFWWGSVFLVNVPAIALLLLLGPSLLPEYRDRSAGRLDLTSVVLSLGTILPFIYGLKELARTGLDGQPVAAMLTGAAVGILFARRQRHLADPLLDLSLFANRSFSVALGVMLVGGATMGGVYLFVTQYLQLVEGLAPLPAGLWVAIPSVLMIGSTMVAPAIAQRVRPGYVVSAGFVGVAAGFLLLTQVGGNGGPILLVTGFAAAAVGIAPSAVLTTDIIVGAAPPEKAGSAGSVSEMGAELGVAVGIATFGSLGTAVYRGQVGGSTIPADVPAEAVVATRDTLASGSAAAEQLPAGLAAELLEPAREAFTSGLHAVAGLSAIAALVFAALTVALLRHVRPSGEVQLDPERSEDDDETEGAGTDGAVAPILPPEEGRHPEPVPALAGC